MILWRTSELRMGKEEQARIEDARFLTSVAIRLRHALPAPKVLLAPVEQRVLVDNDRSSGGLLTLDERLERCLRGVALVNLRG